MRSAISVSLLALLMAGCSASVSTNNQAAGNGVAQMTDSSAGNVAINGAEATNMVANGAAAASGPLSAYVGRLPWDEVNGVNFVSHPLVRRAVDAAVPDAEIRRTVLSARIVSSEISLEGGRVISTGCEPHNCGPHQWRISIDPAGTAAEVCYFSEAAGNQSRTYVAGQPVRQSESVCN